MVMLTVTTVEVRSSRVLATNWGGVIYRIGSNPRKKLKQEDVSQKVVGLNPTR